MACIVAYSSVYYIEQGAYTPGVPPELRNTFRAEVICHIRSELYSQQKGPELYLRQEKKG